MYIQGCSYSYEMYSAIKCSIPELYPQEISSEGFKGKVSWCLLLTLKCKSKLQWGTTSHQSEWPSPKKATNNKCWKGCGEKRILLHCWWKCNLIQYGDSFKKLGIKLPYGPAIPLLGLYPEKIIIEKDTCTPMFTAASFT